MLGTKQCWQEVAARRLAELGEAFLQSTGRPSAPQQPLSPPARIQPATPADLFGAASQTAEGLPPAKRRRAASESTRATQASLTRAAPSKRFKRAFLAGTATEPSKPVSARHTEAGAVHASLLSARQDVQQYGDHRRQAAGEAIRPAYSVMSHPEASFNKGIKRNARIAKGFLAGKQRRETAAEADAIHAGLVTVKQLRNRRQSMQPKKDLGLREDGGAFKNGILRARPSEQSSQRKVRQTSKHKKPGRRRPSQEQAVLRG